MRIFTVALVASSALLPRSDSALEAAGPTMTGHRDPAAVSLTADRNGASPSRLLRSQGRIPKNKFVGMAQSAVSSAKVDFEDALKLFEQKFKRRWLTHDVMRSRQMTKLFKTSEGNEMKLLAVLRRKNERQVAMSLFKLQQHTLKIKRRYGNTFSRLLMQEWVKEGKTPTDVLKILGLGDHPILALFEREDKSAGGVLMDYCKHLDMVQGMYLYHVAILDNYANKVDWYEDLMVVFIGGDRKLVVDFVYSVSAAVKAIEYKWWEPDYTQEFVALLEDLSKCLIDRLETPVVEVIEWVDSVFVRLLSDNLANIFHLDSTGRS